MALIAFAGMMAYFVVRAAQNPEPLITERYYEQELLFQARIDARTRTLGLAEPVGITATRDQVRVTFPMDVRDRHVAGELVLLRANDAQEDRTVGIDDVRDGVFAAPVDLRPGRYIAQLEWRADTVTYYSEEQLIVP